MTVRISQIDEQESGRTILRVEGALLRKDAELLERLCSSLNQHAERSLVIDLSCITFLDSDSASVLCRLKEEQRIAFAGVHLFTRQMIESREKQGRSGTEEKKKAGDIYSKEANEKALK
jgi:anti-anti-sigma regulatory factor